MTATPKLEAQRRNIQVYFLAAPEDQAVCEDIVKHLKPIIRSSPVPIEVNSDFNIPGGAEKEKHKARILEADIVLALISVDFIDNDDIYNRNQKVIERYNRRETVMIPILVRNFMWKATPFSTLPVVPKNLQPLNNKQFWNSHDDALMAVVHDIYESINGLAERQRAVLEPFAAATAEQTPDIQKTSEPFTRRAEPSSPKLDLPPTESEAVQPTSMAEVGRTMGLEVASEASMEEPESASSVTELTSLPGEAMQSVSTAKMESVPPKEAPIIASVGDATSRASAAVPIAADWRKRYYTTVLLKRGGAILLDQILLIIVPFFFLGLFQGMTGIAISDGAINLISILIYFGVVPLMETSRWQGTIGKRILKLQITNREGERITFPRALWRNLMRTAGLYSYLLFILLPAFLSPALLWFFIGLIPLIYQYFRFKKTRKLFHDELSGTVIGERLGGSVGVQVAMNPV